MAEQTITLKPIKRGDGFARACVYKQAGVPTSLDGFDDITSEMRDSAGNKVGDLAITRAPDQVANPGLFVFTANPNPPDYPIDLLNFDLQFTVAGIPRSSWTIFLPVVIDQTHP